ncbi:hypothetical protein BVRB_016420, partial [Beta vulgaris subsp. vulgaris]
IKIFCTQNIGANHMLMAVEGILVEF